MECEGGFSRVFAWGRQAARLPSFLRPLAPAAGQRFVTVTPVDYAAEGIVEIAFSDDVGDAETFCLAEPEPMTLAELYELVLSRVGGPEPGLKLPVEGRGPVGRSVELFAQVGASVTGALGRSKGPWTFLLQRGDHDTANAQRILSKVGVTCPRLATYFDALYEDYRRRQRRLKE